MDYDTKRIFRRIVVALSYVLIFGGLWLLVYVLRTPPAPSCFDKIQNQGEQGIDCGGPCQSCEAIKQLTVYEASFFPTKPGFVDVFAEVNNPNVAYGVSQLAYTFTLYDRDGQVVGSKGGVTYILPNSTKFIVDQAVPIARGAFKVEFRPLSPKFEEVKNYIKPRLIIVGLASEIIGGQQGGVLAVQGNLANQTNYDLDKVFVAIRLKNELGQTVAVNKHEVRTLDAGAYRFFRATWPYRVPHFTDIQESVDTNVFEESNYLKFLKQR